VLLVTTKAGGPAWKARPSGSDARVTCRTSDPWRVKIVKRKSGPRLARKRKAPVESKANPSTNWASTELSVASVVVAPLVGSRSIREQVAVKRQSAAT
jgi:hypothetical protein